MYDLVDNVFTIGTDLPSCPQASSERANSGLHTSTSRKSALEQTSPSPKTPTAVGGRMPRQKSKDKLARSVSQSVRQSLLRQQSFGTPIAISRQIIQPFGESMANLPSLEQHPYFRILGSLTGGTSGNVLVCLDERTNVSPLASSCPMHSVFLPGSVSPACPPSPLYSAALSHACISSDGCSD